MYTVTGFQSRLVSPYKNGRRPPLATPLLLHRPSIHVDSMIVSLINRSGAAAGAALFTMVQVFAQVKKRETLACVLCCLAR